MKKLAIFTIIGLLLFGITATASADGYSYCTYCCAVAISGQTVSCGGFYIPDPCVKLNGPLANAFKYSYPSWATVVWGDSQGYYSFYGQPSLGNYPGNTVSASAPFYVGSQCIIYTGTSTPFDVNCAMIGQWVNVMRVIPMWVM